MYRTFKFPQASKREYLSEAISEIFSAESKGEPKFAINIPPRSGKSNIIYSTAYELIETGRAPFAIVISPWLFLRRMLVSPIKVNSHIDLYSVTGNIVTAEITDFSNYRFWDIKDKAKRPHIWSATLSCCYNQRINLVNAVKTAIEAGVGRPVIYFDESQILGDNKEMGVLYDELVKAGAFIVTLTGTFYRSDNKSIKGANRTLVSEKDTSVTLRRRIDTSHVEETDYMGVTRKYDMQADFTVEWRTAWDAEALCHINGAWIDSEVNGRKMSEMSKEDLVKARALREVLESPQCVDEFSTKIIEALAYAKGYNSKTSNAAAMVVVGSDTTNGQGEKEIDRHARQVKIALEAKARQLGKNYRVAIITMAEDKLNKESDLLERFIEDGEFDIIIVKMMGLVGLDVARLKVLAVMSTIRKGPMLAQMLTRPLTMWDVAPQLLPKIILPKDAFMVDAYERLVTSQGGEATESDLQIQDKRTIEDEQRPFTPPIIGDAFAAGHFDDALNFVDKDFSTYIRFIREKYPTVTRSLTDAVIAEALRNGEFAATGQEFEQFVVKEKKTASRPTAVNIDEELSDLQNRFNEAAAAYAGSKFSYATDPVRWRECLVSIKARAKSQAGIVDATGNEKSVEKLTQAVKFLEGLIRGAV